MGQQIATAELLEDERALHFYLGQRYNLLAIPHWPPTATPTPHHLGLLTDTEQLFFPAECAPWVLAHLAPGFPGPSREEFFVLECSGLACIEWTRSVVQGGSVIPGRYYLPTTAPRSPEYGPPPEHQRSLVGLMRRLSSYIRRTYPLRSEARYPTFIGPHLAAAARSQHVIVRYAGGSAMPLQPNPSGAT